MDLNSQHNFFLNNFGSAFTFLDTAVQVLSFVIIVILLPILLYSCQKNILRCYQELKRQNHHLQTQSQCLEEMNRSMQYLVDKNTHNEKVPPAEKQARHQKLQSTPPEPPDDESLSQAPISPYKKVI
jgi:type II secretory pathway component PulJ